MFFYLPVFLKADSLCAKPGQLGICYGYPKPQLTRFYCTFEKFDDCLNPPNKGGQVEEVPSDPLKKRERKLQWGATNILNTDFPLRLSFTQDKRRYTISRASTKLEMNQNQTRPPVLWS